MKDIDIYRAARAVLKKCDEDPAAAELHCAMRADELLAAGDMEGRRVWHRVQAAVLELTRRSEKDDEVH